MASGCGSLIMLVMLMDQRFQLWSGCLAASSALVENNTQQGTHVQHNSYYSVVSCTMGPAIVCVYSAVAMHHTGYSPAVVVWTLIHIDQRLSGCQTFPE